MSRNFGNKSTRIEYPIRDIGKKIVYKFMCICKIYILSRNIFTNFLFCLASNFNKLKFLAVQATTSTIFIFTSTRQFTSAPLSISIMQRSSFSLAVSHAKIKTGTPSLDLLLTSGSFERTISKHFWCRLEGEIQ